MARRMLFLIVALACLTGVAAARTASGQPPAASAERWSGSIKLPGGAGTLDFYVRLSPATGGGEAEGSMSIPVQHLKTGPLEGVAIDGASRRFTLKAAPSPKSAWAVFEATVAPDGRTASGSLKQNGLSMRVAMERLSADEPERTGAKFPAPDAPDGADRWSGTIQLPADTKLDFTIRLMPAKTGAGASGTISIPAQGFEDGDLREVEIGKDVIRFTLVPPGVPEAMWAKFTLKPAPDGKTATGTMDQSGGTFDVIMRHLAAGEAAVALTRPQNPKPPFPYSQREVKYANQKGGGTITGTLTVPPGAGPHPAVLMVTGSGQQDRDETIMGHKPFWIIADHLSRHGIAVLRVDDRGMGGSTGEVVTATSEDFAGDVLAGLDFLTAQPEVDRKRIGLIGHSEGGLIAAMVASRSNQVAFVVLLAGPGVPGREVAIEQAATLAIAGADEKMQAESRRLATKAVDLILADAPKAEVRAAVTALVEHQFEAMGVDGKAMTDEQRSAMAAQGLAVLTSPWFRFFMAHDPREDLRKVKVPVLAMNGSLDKQVPADTHLPAIEGALKDASNKGFKIARMEGLNHLFQTATTGAMSEYGTIEETFAPTALKELTDWIRLHALR